ncbi:MULTISPECIES: SusD/RagB family nutrient-binding outer membrane lipoprotein [Sphingobacterium]|uniref:SusD/RagB family nutrient-binding outer membrane lipoprotein n=1 Tax=Sphingobacterium TaxID=28453 RepID=UPI001043999B|nr:MULTISPECIES: SusD/RagB family nutrient-binding outer membrane lipoprotein [unclassified Sphingobacterium]MCS3555461.1 hypothetical protein [Sphingobacterium sp. JUb21]TCR02387.1 SusD-like starch-binding protein associating with outer membrane [Sphingobacterium sp. JUb20]
MKKHISIISKFFLSVIILSNVSCQKQLEDKYVNPDGFTQPVIEGFMTDALQRLGTFRTDYGSLYHTFPVFNRMLGTGGFSNDGIVNTFSWGFNPFESSFDKLRSVNELEIRYNQLSDQEKKDYLPYKVVADVVKSYLFYRLTESHNSIPYSEALQGKNESFFPKFDNQESVYASVLTKLEESYNTFSAYTIGTSIPEKNFASSDVLLKGNIERWKILINSLRLRIAMRHTNANPQLAKTVIQKVLSTSIYANSAENSILHTDKTPDRAFEYLINRAMQEQRSSFYAPVEMVKLLKVDKDHTDPRLYVLFQPDAFNNYSAIRKEGPYPKAYTDSITTADLTKTYPSLYNRTTFEQNVLLPTQIITSTEVKLILSEAALRWPDLNLNATNLYKEAIKESIDKYYAFNKVNVISYTGKIAASQPAAPTTQVITDYVDFIGNKFAQASDLEKKGMIYDQKFIDFNVVNPFDLWSETRRFIKELNARVIKKPSNIRFMERTIYPTSEATNNSQNFMEVAKDNNYTSPVWFTGRTEAYK